MASPSLPPERRWEQKLSRSVYFLGALLFHLVLFLMVATWIVFSAPPRPPEDPTVFLPPKPVDPPSPPNNTADVPKVTGIDVSVIGLDGNLSANPRPPQFPVQVPHLGSATVVDRHQPGLIRTNDLHDNGPSADRLKQIDITVRRYRQDDPRMTGDNVDGVVARFPVYVASYANGDWACNTRLDAEGNIVAGSIPDLVAKINEWSHGKIKGEVVPKPLDVGGPELLDKMPPFIFFTGHKDFVLTEKEIGNLQDYLQRGGAIWGDNALAGEGSRFDVAFRREMKRVVPDKDKNFAPYTLDDPLFTKSYFPIDQIPEGMNYYAELPQHLDIDGKLAIIYTPNDYSDILFMRVLPGDKEVYLPPPVLPPNTLYTDTAFWDQRGVYYRNFNLDGALAVHRLGMNIVAYLLVRFDDKLLLTP